MVDVTWATPSHWMNVLPMYYGIENKHFETHGVNLTVAYFHGGPELCQAISSGQVHIGTIGLPPMCNAIANGGPVKIVASGAIQSLDHYIITKAEISSFADLEGKRLGVLSVGSCDSYLADHILKREGVDPSKVEVVPLKEVYGSMDSFEQVDATFMVDPNASKAEALGYRCLARVGDYIPNFQWTVIWASDWALKNDQKLLRSCLMGYRDSVQAICSDPESAVPIGAKLFDTTEEIFRKALHRNVHQWETECKLNLAGMDVCVDLLKQGGSVAKDFTSSQMIQELTLSEERIDRQF